MGIIIAGELANLGTGTDSADALDSLPPISELKNTKDDVIKTVRIVNEETTNAMLKHRKELVRVTTLVIVGNYPVGRW